MPSQSAAPVGAVPTQATGTGAGGAFGGVLGDITPEKAQALTSSMSGMQNMLGATQEERETNAKALAAAVKDIGGLVSTMGETTLLKRMMEAQGKGLGFVEGSPSPGVQLPDRTPLGGPVMAQLGFR